MKALNAKHPGGRPTSYRPEFCRRVVALMAERVEASRAVPRYWACILTASTNGRRSTLSFPWPFAPAGQPPPPSGKTVANGESGNA